jgi:hypothetical protein
MKLEQNVRYLKTLLEKYKIRGNVAEIGYFRGEGSTPVFLEHVATHGGMFYSMDLFRDERIQEQCRQQFSGYPAEPVPGYSVEVGMNWDKGKLDFLFIDGDHGFPRVSKEGNQSGVALDVMVWNDVLNVDGVLAFHDYTGTKWQYGKVSLLAVENAVDSLCQPPFYEYIGRQGSIVSFQKKRECVLHPFPKYKKAPDCCIDSWCELSREKLSNEVLVWGTGDSGKQVADILLQLNGDVKISFTESSAVEYGTAFSRYPLIPLEAALQFRGDIIIASIHEQAISETLENAGRKHITDYYKYYEFVGWYFVGNTSRDVCLSGKALLA